LVPFQVISQCTDGFPGFAQPLRMRKSRCQFMSRVYRREYLISLRVLERQIMYFPIGVILVEAAIAGPDVCVYNYC
jgi:hypothetical protein